jgi:hypothetical protein
MDKAFQPTSIDAVWTHDFRSEPIRLVSEPDTKRYEVRDGGSAWKAACPAIGRDQFGYPICIS